MATQSPEMQRLLIGPWEHNEIFATLVDGLAKCADGRQGEVDPAEFPTTRFLEVLRSWCGEESMAVPAVEVWRAEASTGRFLQMSTWPGSSLLHRMYLRNTGGGRRDGRLSDERPSGPESAIVWIHDPENPVPSGGGRCWACPGWTEAGPTDQTDIEARDDIAMYTSAPLQSPLDVTGTPRLRLSVKAPASGPADIWAKLVDVTAAGRPLWVSDGVVRLPSTSDPQICIELGEICYRFQNQHRIRLELAASSFPQCELTSVAGPRGVDHRWPATLELPGPRSRGGGQPLLGDSIFHAAGSD